MAQRIRMSLDKGSHGRDLLDDPHFNEPNYAWVGKPLHEDQLTEVLVFGNQYPVLPVCKLKQGFVRRAGPERSGRQDIMTIGGQGSLETP